MHNEPYFTSQDSNAVANADANANSNDAYAVGGTLLSNAAHGHFELAHQHVDGWYDSGL